MNRLKEIIADIFGYLFSVLVACLRLCFLTVNMFISGLHIIIFSHTEICNVEMKGQPLLYDRDKTLDQMSFVDSLMSHNPDLLDFADEQMRKDGELPPEDDNGEA